jgi:predicted transcriptional regulator of viral defense system
MTLAAYATLSQLGPTLTTGEAAAALNVSVSQASRLLRNLEARNLARHVRYGLWVVGTHSVDPRTLVEDITRPYPSYVSFASALSAHGMIDQVPRDISVASLDSAKRVKTQFGTYAVHHLPPTLFGGWAERDGVKLAKPEKALFDSAYVSAVHGGRPRRLPELELPHGFDRTELEGWLNRIEAPRVRTLTARGLRYALGRAIR